ncbi:tumor necrosis factor receptor superfamily member 6-like [Genypterus blacodes]|uniref:tumor necrosis factor receptor superfamily member 6-like n=1 Tax=Genypterus blacodes TaxID=154954 RepID=UPI003F75CC45
MRIAVLFVIFSLLICGPRSYDFTGIFRFKRSVCPNGTYNHEGRPCCLCGASYRLTKHCQNTPDDRTCDPCPADTYSSHPNAQMNCQPCTSCQHPDAGLEEADRCSPARDAVCQCKQNHYCTNSEQPCKVCLLCKDCGDAGVKEGCTDTSDTVCSEKSEGGNTLAIALGVPAAIVVLVLIGLFVWCMKRQCLNRNQRSVQVSGGPTEKEMENLTVPDVDLTPHLTEVANVLGWMVMRDVARSSDMKVDIENSKLNHPSDAHEQTLTLLSNWIEKQGSGASRALVEALQSSKKKDTKEKLMKLLQDISNRSNSPA